MTESVARFADRIGGVMRQAMERDATLSPVLSAWRQQQAELGRLMASYTSTHTQVQAMMRPVAEQMSALQAQWARSLAVPVLEYPRLPSRFTEVVVGSEFTEALRRINELARVPVTMPNDDGITRLAELIDTGEIDEETLSTAEAGVASDADLSAAIDDAAEVLSRSRPWISRKRARQLIVFWVWFMWSAALVVATVAAPPAVAALHAATGLPNGHAAAKRAGEEFDKRYPPEDSLEE